MEEDGGDELLGLRTGVDDLHTDTGSVRVRWRKECAGEMVETEDGKLRNTSKYRDEQAR